MNLTVRARDVLAKTPGLVNELDSLTTRINTVFGAEHHADGSHKFLPGGPRMLGQWTDFTPVLSANTGSVTLSLNRTSRVAVMGAVVVVMFYWELIIGGTPAFLILELPDHLVATHYAASVGIDSSGTSVLIQTTPGGQQINFWRNTAGTGNWVNGPNIIGGTAIVPIAE